jgi:DNA-binding MarR family transcriptional regulator
MTRSETLQAIFDNWGPMKRSIHGYMLQHFGELGLSPAQLEIIKTIHYYQPLSHKVLAKKMQLTPGGVSQLLEGLEQTGFVMRAPDPSDRRVVYLSLSPKGAQKIDEFHQVAKQLLGDVFEQLEDKELIAYLHVQQKLIEHLKQYQQHTHKHQED